MLRMLLYILKSSLKKKTWRMWNGVLVEKEGRKEGKECTQHNIIIILCCCCCIFPQHYHHFSSIYIWCQQLARIVILSTWYSPSTFYQLQHLPCPIEKFPPYAYDYTHSCACSTDINIKLYIISCMLNLTPNNNTTPRSASHFIFFYIIYFLAVEATA